MDQKIDVEKVVNWLNRQWQGAKVCPICKNNNWNISEKPVELREFHGGGFVVGGPVYPLISIICKICGYTLLFNAIVAGLLAPEQKDAASLDRADKSKLDDKEE